jgi:RNA ligase (TIGR02306 family)
MTEWYCEVVRIGKVEKHPNADALEITHVMGDYPVVMKLGQFKEGDLASYIAIDTVCDLTRPEFSFLEKPRIKAKRLRGFYSQGLLISAPEGFTEGQSVVEHFGLKKYVYEEEVLDILALSEEERAKYFIPKYDRSVNLSKTISASAESPPTDWAALYYDLESVRKYKYLLIDGEEVVITEKLEGSNVHFRHDGNRLWTKSRNQYKKFNEKDHFWEAAIRYNLEEKLAKYPQYGFYGELIGRISPFFYDCELVDGAVQTRLKFFDIYDYNQNRFLEYDDMMVILNDLGLETPPLLYRGPWSYSKEILDLAEQDCQLRGNIPKSTMLREGLVIRPTRHHNNRARVVLKYKGEKYNLFK